MILVQATENNIIFDGHKKSAKNKFIFDGFSAVKNNILFLIAHPLPPKLKLCSMGFFVAAKIACATKS
jgi:hypothetical protein